MNLLLLLRPNPLNPYGYPTKSCALKHVKYEWMVILCSIWLTMSVAPSFRHAPRNCNLSSFTSPKSEAPHNTASTAMLMAMILDKNLKPALTKRNWRPCTSFHSTAIARMALILLLWPAELLRDHSPLDKVNFILQLSWLCSCH